MEISREQATNFWKYFTLSSNREFRFFIMMPSFFNETKEDIENLRPIFHNDVQIKRKAELLANIINRMHLSEDGEDNKHIVVMEMARAYVKFLDAQFGNKTYMNPGSFWLICCRIALHVI